MPSFATIAASVIFLATYVIVAIGKIPVYRIDRAGAALLGGSLMVGLGILTADEAYQAISFDTLTLLLGMMIVAANLRVSGFFRLVTYWVTQHVRRPLALLAAVVIVCGAFSAVLVNDTVCLVMTPLVLDVVLRLKRNPMPYLLAIAMGSNIGSVATITGNPQNMIVASLSHVPYGAFAAALAIALGKIPSLPAYRNFILVGCAFPDTLSAVSSPVGYLERHDWKFYVLLLAKLPKGTHPVKAAAMVVDSARLV